LDFSASCSTSWEGSVDEALTESKSCMRRTVAPASEAIRPGVRGRARRRRPARRRR
jgi:hypothetical protein